MASITYAVRLSALCLSEVRCLPFSHSLCRFILGLPAEPTRPSAGSPASSATFCADPLVPMPRISRPCLRSLTDRCPGQYSCASAALLHARHPLPGSKTPDATFNFLSKVLLTRVLADSWPAFRGRTKA